MFIVESSRLSSRESNLLKRLERDYTPEVAERVLKPLLTQTSPVSLRALDWAVVNWSKQHNVVCSSMTPGEMTNVHNAYKVTLAYWKRTLFDPFRRRDRIGVRIGDETYETTLGQANFVLFAYRTGLLAYVMSNIEAIEADMNRVSQQQKVARREAAKRGIRRRRKELTPTPSGSCLAYRSNVRVSFR